MIKNRVRELRQSRGWSQEDLARRVHSTNQSISKLELGETRINTDWLEKLSKAFDCGPEEILDLAIDRPLMRDIIADTMRIASDRPGGLSADVVAQIVCLAYDQARHIKEDVVRRHAIPAIVRALAAQTDDMAARHAHGGHD